jgi:hypothetical protein
VIEEARLLHHEEMIESADAVVETLDLRRHLVGCAVHHHALLLLVLERLRTDRSGASSIHALQRLHVERDRHVAWRVAVLRRDLDVDVPGQLARAALGVGFGFTGIDQRHERHAATAWQSRIAISAAIGVEHLTHLVVGLQEGREHVAAACDFADRLEVARAGNPDRRMRALIGPRPDIDGAAVGEAAFEPERTIVGGPRLHDQIDALPQPLDCLGRIGVGGIDLVGHAAHEA